MTKTKLFAEKRKNEVDKNTFFDLQLEKFGFPLSKEKLHLWPTVGDFLSCAYRVGLLINLPS